MFKQLTHSNDDNSLNANETHNTHNISTVLENFTGKISNGVTQTPVHKMNSNPGPQNKIIGDYSGYKYTYHLCVLCVYANNVIVYKQFRIYFVSFFINNLF